MRIRALLLSFLSILCFSAECLAQAPTKHVAVLDMKMMILPGTAHFLSDSIERAQREGAEVLIVQLNTPGGMLDSSQEMIQSIFASPVPIIVYVSPTGGTATSAGVFITLAAHVAAMAPGTSMGAAHPVAGDGKDIEGDMRAKAENMTMAMVRSISEQRGRNVSWAERAVKESSSVTETEALKLEVIDLIAEDLNRLIASLKGRQVRVLGSTKVLPDLTQLPMISYEMPLRERALNVLANPNILALLWLGATTGLSLELYNPGAVLPGVVGVICLVLALAVSQVIPVSHGALLLLIVGALLIALEFFVTSGVLAVGGIIAIVIGASYLIDASMAPGLEVNYLLIQSFAAGAGLLLFAAVFAVRRVAQKPPATGSEGMIGQHGIALETFTAQGQVFVHGEVWKATAPQGVIEKDQKVKILGVREGLVLEVELDPH